MEPANDRQMRSGEMDLGGAELCADVSGVLYWPAERLLCVADLHFEKGSSFARFGQFLPPYDTRATLMRLQALVARYDPRVVIALGDSFHDGDGPGRLAFEDRAALLSLQQSRDWIWIAGNHDPDPATGIGGHFHHSFRVGRIVFRHEPSHGSLQESSQGPLFGGGDIEIAGHLHPMARVSVRGRSLSRKCFVSNGRRVVMPAFGAFTGGLNVRNAAFRPIFGRADFTAHMLGDTRLYAMPGSACLPD